MQQPMHGSGSPGSAGGPTVDNGISLASVVVMLVALGALVVGIYWGLPAYFGSSVIEVTIRN